MSERKNKNGKYWWAMSQQDRIDCLLNELAEKDRLYTALTSQATGMYGKIDWLEKKVKEQKVQIETNAHDNLHEILNGVGGLEKEEE